MLLREGPQRAILILLLTLALCSAVSVGQTLLSDVKLKDVEGKTVSPLKSSSLTVFLFVRSDCPISNRYAPIISRLAETFTRRGFGFWLVYVDPDESNRAIINHLDQYRLRIRALRDPQHALVAITGVTVTPEAVVIRSDQIVYRGRIDDRYVTPGSSRPEPTSNDLERVLDAVAEGRAVVPSQTSAVGCLISDLSPGR